MPKADIKMGEHYAVPCKKVGCHSSMDDHLPEPDDLRALPRPLSKANRERVLAHMYDPRQVLHRCLVTAKPRRGVEIEVPPGIRRLTQCTCPVCGTEHIGTVETTGPERQVISSRDITCHWDQTQTWMLTRGHSGISFGDVDTELNTMLRGGDDDDRQATA